ncbi:MAG: MarR family winged helix-turn-helix transcriptional regulator [Clostridia bacterium]|nr:MarR family winged helix-turn-helix transcriptional regulator [Clostridia bacterium]
MRTLVSVHIQKSTGVKVCQKDVENHLNLRPSSVSTLISNLENDGFLVRGTDEENARKKYLELTGKGKEVCKEDKQMMEGCDRIVQSALSEEEQLELAVLLDKIIEKIERR